VSCAWITSGVGSHSHRPRLLYEDIPIIGTTTPTTQQGPITRARARQLNYQVKSFLAVQTSYSPNGVLLKPCDDFLMIRNLKAESYWRKHYSDNKQVEGGMRKRRIGPKNQTASSDSLFGPPRTSTGHNSPKGVGGSWALDGKPLKPIFRWIKKHCQIPSESPSNYKEMFGPPVLGWQPCIKWSPLGAHSMLGFPPSHASWLSPM
jgi:hypothetical protein